MRKKLDTRFPASRIKKIMQADEDVGKIAMAVPLLVSKALELFLQDLCDQTYEITLQRGAKTMSSFHLKQCVQSFGVFDFLRHIVSKVPDIGSSDAAGEDRSAKRRKAMEEEDDSDEDTKRSKTEAAGHSSSGRGRCRGRGRGRWRGRGRGILAADRDLYDKCEEDPDTSPQQNAKPQLISSDQPDDSLNARDSKEPIDVRVRNFDLNVNLDESGDTTAVPATGSDAVPVPDVKPEEYPGWSFSDMDKMPIDPVQFVLSNRQLDEEEDYDNEDS